MPPVRALPPATTPRTAVTPVADAPVGAARPRARRLATVVAAVVAGALALSGCGLRLESDPPAAPVADADESARQRAAVDAAAIALAASGVSAPDEASAALVERAAQAAEAHVTALGGVYEDLPPAGEEETASEPSPTPTAEPLAVTVADLVATLAAAGSTARADVAGVDDPALARLLASVATQRLVVAEDLARATGLDADPLAEVRASVAATVLPTITPSVASALATAEDAAGFTWEVVAARQDGAARDAAAARADRHRDLARAWAGAAAVAGTDLDPRRSTYPLPAAVTGDDDAALAEALGTIEIALAADYATTLTDAAPADRLVLVDLLVLASATARDVGGRLPTFPGMPEQA